MIDLLEKHPYTAEVIREWFMKKMITSFKDQEIPQDFKEFMRQKGVPNDRLVKLIENTPRVLFDVFDDNELIINVIHSAHGFSWNIADDKDDQFYSSRKNAEMIAVERAFIILNNKLDEGQDSGTSGE